MLKSHRRESTFTYWTLRPKRPEVLVVEDAHLDPRFKDNVIVANPPHVRFFAGKVAGQTGWLGCVVVGFWDVKPRTLDADSCNLL
eukprot:jgi/Astpho2/3853/gw1.00062.124.1_t